MSTLDTPHFKSNLRDTYFQLFELLEIQNTSLGKGPYAALDEATIREALKASEKLAPLRLRLPHRRRRSLRPQNQQRRLRLRTGAGRSAWEVSSRRRRP
jgi:hypothetical protein